MIDKPPLSAEDFYQIDVLGDPRLSPDGAWVAFARRSVNRQENGYRSAIWLAPAGGGAPKPFTAGTHRDTCPRWSPDGRFLAFLSDRGGEKTQLYVMPVDGGEARRLTSMPNGVESPAWSPDGRQIAFTAWVDAYERAQEEEGAEPPSDPDERKVWQERLKLEREKREDPRMITRFPYRAGTRYLGDRYPHIYLIEVPDRLVKGKEDKPRRITEADRMYGAPVWTVDGSAILTSVNRDPASADLHFPSDIVRIPAAGGEPEVLVGAPGDHSQPKPSPDGGWIAYLTQPEEHYAAQNANVALMPVGGGETRLLTASLDANVLDYEWDKDSAGVCVVFSEWGNVGLHRVPVDGEVRQLVSGDRTVLGFDVGADRLAYIVTAPDIPADLFVADREGEGEERLTEVNADFLAQRWLSTPQEIRYTRPDGTPIQGWVMHPPEFDPQSKHPLVVEIHGGPHAMWGNTFWHEFQVIAGRGYVVFFCNPRGSDGYGQAFRDAIHGQWGEADADDILAGVNGLLKQGYVDEERLAVTGGSYGGFMTAWIIGHDQRFAAAVSQRGVYELVGFYGVTDIPRFVEAEFDVAPWQDVQTLWRYSPLAYVEQIHTPLLIVHSDLDFRVPVATGEQLFAALKRLGREVAMVRYPREGHELSRSGEPRHRVDRINRIVDWFDRYTRPES